MSQAIQLEGRPVGAEIPLAAITHNLRVLQKQVGRKRKILAVVKANAYGLGAVAISRALAKEGTDWFGETCTAEGMELRDAGIRQPILLLSGFWPGEEKRLLKYRLTPTVTRVEQLGLLERAAASRRNARCKLSFHLKVETGMNRLGILPCEAERFARTLADCPHLELGGTFTHFASADTFLHDQTDQQERVFRQFLE